MAAGPVQSGGAAAPDVSSGDGGLPGFGEAHRRLLGDESIQFDLRRPDGSDAALPPPPMSPNPTAPTPPPPIHHDPSPASSPGGGPDPFSGGHDAAASGAAVQLIFWVVIGLAAAALLFFIISRVAGWRRTPKEKAATGPAAAADDSWQMPLQPARTLLDQADALAASGRYAEAARFLLHRSIEEIAARRPAAIRKALTSRDIAGLPGLPAAPAAGFAGIVRAVERSLFADRALGPEDWARCRADYQVFAFTENRAR